MSPKETMSVQPTPPATAASNLTPPSEDTSNNNFAPYLPHDLEYGAAFEDALMDAILDGGLQSSHGGIRVIPNDSDEVPVEGISIRDRDISLQDLPSISQDELPLALDDPRRIFASAIPGIKLTHPGGYLEGGPGLDPEMDTFPEDFFSNNTGIQTNDDLEAAKQKEIDNHMEALKERLMARRRAVEKNEQIRKELKYLMDQRETELKVQQRVADEIRARKEAKTRKMRQKQGT